MAPRKGRALLVLPVLPVLPVLCGLLACGAAWAQHTVVTDRMLAGVVYVECDVEFQGETLLAGSGTGFLVASSDHVVTNNHVVSDCNPDNRINVLKKKMVDVLMSDLQKGKLPPQMVEELTAHPEAVERLKTDEEFRQRYVQGSVDRIATNRAKAAAPNIVQKLYVVVLGKSSQEPVRFDVTRIVWNSETSNERAGATGVDLAILKLDRSIPGGLPARSRRAPRRRSTTRSGPSASPGPRATSPPTASCRR